MAASSVLKAIKRTTSEALNNFVPVAGQSITKQVASTGAREASVTAVHIAKYNGVHKAAYFSVKTKTVKEDHWFVEKSARLEYIIIRSDPSGTGKQTLETVYSAQMPQEGNDGSGGAGSSKSTSTKRT